MMARRIAIHAAFLCVGVSLGLVVAWVLHTQLGLEWALVFVVAAFIFVSQIIASLIPDPAQAPPKEVVSKEPVIRGTQAWGWLKPLNGIGAGFPLNKECIRLGRGVEMDILLNNASISRRHAQIRRLPDGCMLEDLGSRNGVFVNGDRVQERALRDGDNVWVGDVKFVFVKVHGRRREDVEGASEERASAETPVLYRRATDVLEPVPAEDAREARPFDETSDVSEEARNMRETTEQ